MEGRCLVDVEMMLESFGWPQLESQGYLCLGQACSSLMERAIAVLVSLFLIQNGKCNMNYYKKLCFQYNKVFCLFEELSDYKQEQMEF